MFLEIRKLQVELLYNFPIVAMLNYCIKSTSENNIGMFFYVSCARSSLVFLNLTISVNSIT